MSPAASRLLSLFWLLLALTFFVFGIITLSVSIRNLWNPPTPAIQTEPPPSQTT